VDLGGFPGGVQGGASPGTLSNALGLNANGQVVGEAYEANGTCDPAMWTYNGSSWTITNLNPTHSVCRGQSTAWAVNDNGDAVGYGDPATSALLFQPGGNVVLLPGLGAAAPSDHARGINDSGVIVGDSATASSGSHAFIYDATNGTQDLNNLVVDDGSDAGWTLKYATGITNSGYISGYGTVAGGATDAFLLTPVLPGDANEDGKVDVNDLTIVLSHYGQTGTTWNQGEFTGDGKVDVNDLTIVLAHYGQSLGASAGGIAAVPEPSAILLISVGAIGLLGCVWRPQKHRV
jgi:probable HAF family extracellular repeat protein